MVTPKGSDTERVIFEWPAIPTAKGYEFRLYDKDNKLMRQVRTIGTWMPVNLAHGSSYAWSVQPLNSMSEPVKPIDAKDRFRFAVGVPTKELRGVVVEMPPVQKAVRYRFEFVTFETETKTSEPTFYESREPIFRARLEPGDYEMRVRSEYDDNTFSDWSAPHRIMIPIPKVNLVGPVKNEMIDPTDDLAAEVKLSWQKMKHARQYSVSVWNEKNERVFHDFTDKTSITVGVPHESKYRWHVKALLAREKPREPAADEPIPDDTGTFRVDHYVRLNLSAAEEPSQLYAWGRYLTSVMDYQSGNYDDNTKLSEKVFGGTGELAAGYWHRKTSRGLLATAAMSGFTIKNMTYTYAHTSLLLGYRTRDEGPVRWRVWLGPALHQTPEILLDGSTQKLHFSKVESLGPELRAIYMRELRGNYGLQLYASYYLGMSSRHTPNGLQFKGQDLYNVGIFGTLRLRKDIVGLLGYSYQGEGARYQSADAFTNGVNHFQFTGHFLSATLQIGLEKPQR